MPLAARAPDLLPRCSPEHPQPGSVIAGECTVAPIACHPPGADDPCMSQLAIHDRGKTEPITVANVVMKHRRTLEPPAPFDPVAEWRRRRLLAAGFAPDLAARLAENCAIDLHAMLELIDRGCPPELAARILAPLDERRRPC